MGFWPIRACAGSYLYHKNIYLCISLTKRVVKISGYWPSSLFALLLVDQDRTSLVNEGFIMLRSTPSCRFVFLLLCLPVFVAKCILETHQHFCFLCFHSRLPFRFSRFLVPSRQRNHRKSFYCHGKYFAKENFCVPAWKWKHQRGQCKFKDIVSIYGTYRSGTMRLFWFVVCLAVLLIVSFSCRNIVSHFSMNAWMLKYERNVLANQLKSSHFMFRIKHYTEILVLGFISDRLYHGLFRNLRTES